GLGEALLLGHGDEVFQLAQLHEKDSSGRNLRCRSGSRRIVPRREGVLERGCWGAVGLSGRGSGSPGGLRGREPEGGRWGRFSRSTPTAGRGGVRRCT